MYSVLVVDDTVENIDILTGVLKDEYNVKAATNGNAALKIAEKTLPDIILLDVMMPEMNGYEVCSRLKENPITKKIPVIFVTAKDQEGDEVMGFSVGAVDYITKPISPSIVKARIKTHIALADQKRGLEIEVMEKTREINDTRLEIIKKLGRAAEFKDNETGMHVERMSRYSYLIAKEYGLEESQCILLMNAAPMHDIGKIGIPDNVLKKAARLDSDEWKIMEGHSEIGAEILGDSKSELIGTAKILAMQHHEKWDGTGYPKGIKGEEINIFARITAVADVFDALTSRRPYKQGWPIQEAVDYIKSESGEQFDPKVVEAFEKALPKIIEIKEKYSG